MEKFLALSYRIAKFIFALCLVFFAVRLLLYHYHLVVFPYSVSLREGAMMTSTDALVKGLNPYDMSLQPRVMNQYGIVYPLLVWPWSKLFGTGILVHRIVSAFFVLASCLLIFFVLKKEQVPFLLNGWAVLMFYASLLYPGTSTAVIDPGGVGTFFFLLTVFIPWFCNFSYRSLFFSVVCGLLGFYTKSYTCFGVFIILSYVFLFVSQIKGLVYGLLLGLLTCLSVAVVNHFCNAYFDNCFFSHVAMEHAWASTERLNLQLFTYTALHAPALILVGVFWICFGFRSIGHRPLALYAILCSSLILYVSLGRHSGAMLWYFFQLLSPFVLVSVVLISSRYVYWPLIALPFLVFNLYIMTMADQYTIFNKSMAGWSNVATAVKEHQRILNSPLIAPLLIEQKKEVFDNGQAEYFIPGGQRPSWLKRYFKEDKRVSLQMVLFFYNLRTMVQNKEFDLIIVQPTLLPMGVAEDIRKYYKYEGEFLLYAPQDGRPYPLTIWKPL